MTKTIRRLTVSAIGMLVASSAVLVSTSPAHADGCSWWKPCGEVHNHSAGTMDTTVGLGTRTMPDRCAVWNKNGGNTPVWWHTKCHLVRLTPGHSRGGGNVDVDAFTYDGRGSLLTCTEACRGT